MSDPSRVDAQRLEAMWQGEFGDAYTARNAVVSDHRGPFWTGLLKSWPCTRLLEVGCNLGANLKWIGTILPPREIYGVDVNECALAQVRMTLSGVNAVWARARELPFRDRFFDLVFTSGVLIHQPPETLRDVMSEIVRCSAKYVLAMEYFAPTHTEIPYRGQSGALFKADYGRLYQEAFPFLRRIDGGELPRSTGWDDLTWWLFERSS